MTGPIPLQAHGPANAASYDAIAAAAEVYRATVAAGDLPVRLGASEDVLRARLALAECLMDVGWQPSARILAMIHKDEDLLLQSNGGLDLSDLRGAARSERSR
jgi:hypothetical protein